MKTPKCFQATLSAKVIEKVNINISILSEQNEIFFQTATCGFTMIVQEQQGIQMNSFVRFAGSN